MKEFFLRVLTYRNKTIIHPFISGRKSERHMVLLVSYAAGVCYHSQALEFLKTS